MTGHRHAHGDEPKCVPIDPAVCLQPVDHSSAPAGVVLNTPEADAYGTHPAGFILGHDRPGLDVRCEGFVSTDGCDAVANRNRWAQTGTLEGGDLTLAPSILCRLGSASTEECGFHGFVTAGAWVPA